MERLLGVFLFHFLLPCMGTAAPGTHSSRLPLLQKIKTLFSGGRGYYNGVCIKGKKSGSILNVTRKTGFYSQGGGFGCQRLENDEWGHWG